MSADGTRGRFRFQRIRSGGGGTALSDLMRHSRVRAVAAGIVALTLGAASLAGCVALDGVGGLAVAEPRKAARDVQIFVASTRPLADEGVADGATHLSLTTVSVPAGHEAGHLETASFGDPDPRGDFAIRGRRTLDEAAFEAELASHISGRVGSNRDVLVFVHGFNTGFDEARFRLAQIVTDGGFNGVPVLFTWPSKGSLLGYGSDREAATASRDALERLLRTLAATPDVGRIHVLAHSMGGWLAMEALRETAISGHADLDGHLGDIILAAPDIDQAVFRQQLERLGPGARVSVFASTGDRALAISGFMADGPRLGAIDPSTPEGRAAIEGLGVHVIDLTRDGDGIIGHGTYASVPEVIRGIGAEIGAPRKEDRDRQAVLGGEPAEPRFSGADAPVVATPLRPSPLPAAPTLAVP